MPRYIKSDDNTFEFDDDVSDDEAMRAIDDWGLQQPSYSKKQVNDIASKFGQFLRDLPENYMSWREKNKNELTESIDTLADPDADIEKKLRAVETFVGPGGGAVGMMGGKLAKHANLLKSVEAEELLSKSIDPEDVWKQTGWYKDFAGDMKFEIPDTGSRLMLKDVEFKERPFDIKGSKVPAPMHLSTVGKVFNHPQLFKNYPEVSKIGIKVIDDSSNFYRNASGSHGWYEPDKNMITVIGDPKDPKQVKQMHETMLHEIQHYIQKKEGFALGGSATGQTDKTKATDYLMNYAYKLHQEGKLQPEIHEAVKEKIKEIQKYTPRQIYDRLSGELEAFNVEERFRKRDYGSYPLKGMRQDQIIKKELK